MLYLPQAAGYYWQRSAWLSAFAAGTPTAEPKFERTLRPKPDWLVYKAGFTLQHHRTPTSLTHV